jgi:uncharacterized protein YjdB
VRNAQAAHLAEATAGEFEIMRQLGLGAMGAVYLAKDVALNRHVAIKVIASNLLQDNSMVSRFRLEAQTVASLRHPNIVNVHAVRQVDDLHFFVMDFIDGPPLRTIVKTHAPLEIPIVQAILYQVGSALDYAHRTGAGVIHRDIKPANIMVDLQGDAFVTDFGISKIAESQTGLTQTGATIGTPEYMSPEQCRGEALTGASDQYAVGIVAYEMICGNTPFTGSQYFIMVAHTSEEPKPISDVRPDCPAHVAAAVHRMLAKDPSDRWPDLEAAMAAMGGAPMGYRDPVRVHITALAGSTAELRALDTAPPLSPVPGRSSTETATSVTVLGLPTRIEVGDVFTLAADVRDARQGSVPGSVVTWASTDPQIAAVTAGRVEALVPGNAVITAAVGSINHSVSVMVAEASTAEVSVDPPSAELDSGESLRLTASIRDRHGGALDRPVRWLTSDATIASVSRDGDVAATGSGVVTITADSEGMTGTAEIMVRATGERAPVGVAAVAASSSRSLHPMTIAIGILGTGAVGVWALMNFGLLGAGAPEGPAVAVVEAVELDPLPDTIQVGDSLQLTARPRDAAGAELLDRTVAWDSDLPQVANVLDGGLLVALSGGSVTLSATIEGVQALATVVVSEQAAGADPSEAMGEGSTAELAGETRIPTVEAEEPGAGVESEDPSNQPAEQRTPARPRPADLRLGGAQNPLLEGQSRTLTVDVLSEDGARMPSEGRNVTWRSDDESVATIDRRAGTVTAVGVGRAEIEARLGPLREVVRIEVVARIAEVRIEDGDLSLEVGASRTLGVAVLGPGGDIVDEPLAWRSANPAVASIESSGLLRALGPGSTEIVVEAGGLADRIAVEVSEPPPSLPTAAEVRSALGAFLYALNENDVATVTRLLGSPDAEGRGDLVDVMAQSRFEAALEGVGEPRLEAGVARADFAVSASYRTSFGGGRETSLDFRGDFVLTETGWLLTTVTVTSNQ